jgi:hypothetical protein
MTKLSLKEVKEPTHIQFVVVNPGMPHGDPPIPAQAFLIEVYAGNIAVQYEDNSRTIDHRHDTCFIPINNSTVQAYSETEIETTTCVSIANFTTAEEQANLVAVDRAVVKLEPQSIGGVAGTPMCLVLHVDLAVLNSNLRSIAYNVTVKSASGTTEITLEGTAAPD